MPALSPCFSLRARFTDTTTRCLSQGYHSRGDQDTSGIVSSTADMCFVLLVPRSSSEASVVMLRFGMWDCAGAPCAAIALAGPWSDAAGGADELSSEGHYAAQGS